MATQFARAAGRGSCLGLQSTVTPQDSRGRWREAVNRRRRHHHMRPPLALSRTAAASANLSHEIQHPLHCEVGQMKVQDWCDRAGHGCCSTATKRLSARG